MFYLKMIPSKSTFSPYSHLTVLFWYFHPYSTTYGPNFSLMDSLFCCFLSSVFLSKLERLIFWSFSLVFLLPSSPAFLISLSPCLHDLHCAELHPGSGIVFCTPPLMMSLVTSCFPSIIHITWLFLLAAHLHIFSHAVQPPHSYCFSGTLLLLHLWG